MKEDEGQKRHEQEAFDGSGVMLQDMIGVPALDQLIETVVFDVPPPPRNPLPYFTVTVASPAFNPLADARTAIVPGAAPARTMASERLALLYKHDWSA